MARARRLAAAGAVVAFTAGGAIMVTGVGTAAAQNAADEPRDQATCLLPVLPCEVLPSLGVPDLPIPNLLDPGERDERHDDGPPPQDKQERDIGDRPDHTWQPVTEDERRMPQGHPETGGGGLASGTPAWPFAAGGAALLAGAVLTGYAVRRGRDEAAPAGRE
ncbi:hypothetical protein [Nonomuraea rhizosphaerae]|uniref:hypothetical protein n=1 Tax=Nonomuraea rhizosphaerae TaxID=2665663 RepID=UPI001C5E1039|nr:hypothetical protein [Nonomuraea rhizosphaerae]